MPHMHHSASNPIISATSPSPLPLWPAGANPLLTAWDGKSPLSKAQQNWDTLNGKESTTPLSFPGPLPWGGREGLQQTIEVLKEVRWPGLAWGQGCMVLRCRL